MSPSLPLSPCQDWPFDADLLRRYDRPGPRYTSYPTAPNFHSGFGSPEYTRVATHSNVGVFSRQLSLYAHIPYCRNPCFYCGCNRKITRDVSLGETYLTRLQKEVALVAPLFEPDREVIQVHLGGGTPNFLSPDQLERLLQTMRRHFNFSQAPERDFSIELDPRYVTPADIATLARIGFNRASLGVQDFDPQVQVAVNRIQSEEETLAVLNACRQHGMRSVNVDLIYGLPLQTLEGFGRTLDKVVAARPDRLAVYGYAHLPHMFKAQRQIDEQDLPSAEQKLALLGLAVEKLSAAGYAYIGMDHFALPEDDLAQAQQRGGLHRNFMGYTTHAETDLVGLGVSAISHVGDSFSQSHRELPEWEAAIDAGELPVWRGLMLDADDVLRADVIQRLMCQGEVEYEAVERAHDIRFGEYFRDSIDALAPLMQDGLVQVLPDRIRVTSRGRSLQRVMAMRFDRYLADAGQAQRFSRVI